MDLNEKIHTYLQDATDEETAVLDQIIDGLLATQRKEQLTYLSGITHAEATIPNTDTFAIRVPITPLIHNPLNIVHGGMTATLLDSTMGGAAMQVLPDDVTAVTSQLNIHYLRPGTGKTLECTATVVHSGKQLVVVEGNAFDDRNRMMLRRLVLSLLYLESKRKK